MINTRQYLYSQATNTSLISIEENNELIGRKLDSGKETTRTSPVVEFDISRLSKAKTVIAFVANLT